jgi:hypothetical protein
MRHYDRFLIQAGIDDSSARDEGGAVCGGDGDVGGIGHTIAQFAVSLPEKFSIDFTGESGRMSALKVCIQRLRSRLAQRCAAKGASERLMSRRRLSKFAQSTDPTVTIGVSAEGVSVSDPFKAVTSTLPIQSIVYNSVAQVREKNCPTHTANPPVVWLSTMKCCDQQGTGYFFKQLEPS